MSLFDKFQQLRHTRAWLDAAHLTPFGLVTESLGSPTDGVINGQPVILAGTNNYLGLTFQADCQQAAKVAIDQFGTGTTGSRMANGTYPEHALLEAELAAFYDCRHAMIFSTGYQANLGIISALIGPGDFVLIDADSHASIYDGCRLAQGEVLRFRHNDPADLDKRLTRLGPEKARRTLVIVEGIYSMLGDQAPIQEIVAVKNRHGALLLLDEAHSLGVLGHRGRGLAEAAGVEAEIDFINGTFSKSLAGIGGFCVSRRDELELIRFAVRPYIFTASSSPATVATTRVALKWLEQSPDLRTKLWNNAQRLYDGLAALGLKLGPQVSPIVAVQARDAHQAAQVWQALLQRGVYVNLVLPPGAPNGLSLLRLSVSAAHRPSQIDQIVAAFTELAALLPRELAPA